MQMKIKIGFQITGPPSGGMHDRSRREAAGLAASATKELRRLRRSTGQEGPTYCSWQRRACRFHRVEGTVVQQAERSLDPKRSATTSRKGLAAWRASQSMCSANSSTCWQKHHKHKLRMARNVKTSITLKRFHTNATNGTSQKHEAHLDESLQRRSSVQNDEDWKPGWSLAHLRRFSFEARKPQRRWRQPTTDFSKAQGDRVRIVVATGLETHVWPTSKRLNMYQAQEEQVGGITDRRV